MKCWGRMRRYDVYLKGFVRLSVASEGTTEPECVVSVDNCFEITNLSVGCIFAFVLEFVYPRQVVILSLHLVLAGTRRPHRQAARPQPQ
jgi:hypothetical protein